MSGAKSPFPSATAEQTLRQLNIPFERRPEGGLFVPGDIDLSCRALAALPDLSGVAVAGYFHCHKNRLTSLEGAPQSVGKDFWCDNNQLASLEGAPGAVGGNFHCFENLLTSLEGAPETVGDGFYCSGNRLTTLTGGPRRVGGSFYCHVNRITSLDGAPQSVGASFYCKGNKQLASLEHAPQAFTTLMCDAGVFHSWDDVPDHLAPQTKARLKSAAGA